MSADPRRTCRTIILALAIALAAGSVDHAAAAEVWAPDQNSCNDQPNTIAAVECLEGRLTVWKARLNQAWKALSVALQSDPGSKPRVPLLNAAQTEWVKYRDANCGFYGSEEGTIRQIDGAYCMVEMTQNRAIELQKMAR
jgi:uncharacterized protein YecT (DUF1311 family)